MAPNRVRNFVSEHGGELILGLRGLDEALVDDDEATRCGERIDLIVVTNVMTIVVFALFANQLAMSRRDAQRQVEIQAWHLRRLLPS